MWVRTDNPQPTFKFSSARGTIVLGKGFYLLFASATGQSLSSRGREEGREESPGCTEEPLETFFPCAINTLTWKLICNALGRKWHLNFLVVVG